LVEGDEHYKAKMRAKNILWSALGCVNCSTEEQQTGESFGEEKTWSIDAYGELTIKIGIEIDGKVGHNSKLSNAKDKWRNHDNLNRNEMYTVRFKTKELIGKNALSEDEIIAEIQYRLNKQGLALLRTCYTKKVTPELA
jgi:hypothetical protein